MVENCKRFLNKIEKLKLQPVEFNRNGTMKSKKYLTDYAVEGEDY